MRKALKIVGIIFLIIITLVVILLVYSSLKPAVSQQYYEKVETGGEIESTYMALGTHEVEYMETKVPENYKKYEIYYPEELESSDDIYPVIVVANGTGVKASKYPAVLIHLSSWGFIVVANEEEYSWNGFATDMSLNYLLKLNEQEDSIFYQKIDRQNIGVVGHSQGGVGAVNAVTNTRNMDLYKTVVMQSPTHTELAAALEWDYDISKINIPCLMVAGTEKTDAELIIPLEQMKTMYDLIGDVPIKAMARRKNTNHGYMLYTADGYVTAWFMWQLQGDEYAARAFTGEAPEILENQLWSDQKIDEKQ